MKNFYPSITLLLLALASIAHSSPAVTLNKPKEKAAIDVKLSNDVAENDETLKTSNNFGIGYYPVVYGGIYDLARPPYINYGLGYTSSSYGRYDARWSQYTGYNDYRIYDGYYRRPVYSYWG